MKNGGVATTDRHCPTKFEPRSLLELVPAKVVTHLLAGFREELGASVALFCHDENGTLVRLDPTEEQPGSAERSGTAVCRVFRQDQASNAACAEFERSVAANLLSATARHAQLLPCSPLGVVNMAANVLVEGRPMAAIIGGQRLLAGPNQQERIRHAIRQKCGLRAASLVEALDQEYGTQGRNVCTTEEAEKLLEGLVRFGDRVAELSGTSALLRRGVSEREFTQYWVNRIVEVSLNPVPAQQPVLRECLARLCEFTRVGSDRCGIFTGRLQPGSLRALFSPRAVSSAEWWQTADFMLDGSVVPEVGLYSPGDAPPPIAQAVGEHIAATKHLVCVLVPSPATWRPAHPVALAMLQRAEALERNERMFCEEFLKGILRAFVVAETLRWKEEEDEAIERQIVDIRHSLGTTAQYVACSVEGLIRHVRHPTPGKKGADLADLVRAVEDSINAHVREIDLLATSRTDARVEDIRAVDVFSEVRRQVQLFEAVGRMRGVELAPPDLPAVAAYVVCSPTLFTRGIAALLDNAIKYSYRDDRAVRVSGTLRGDSCEIVIENYGTGIPPQKLEVIRKRSYRASATEDRAVRIKTGLGLAIACEVFERTMGGELELESHPTDSVGRETEDHHLYVTRAIVRFPAVVDTREEE